MLCEWETSNLNPPAFYQLRLGTDNWGKSSLTILILSKNHESERNYTVRVGQWRHESFDDLQSAKQWGIQTAKALLTQMLAELEHNLDQSIGQDAIVDQSSKPV